MLEHELVHSTNADLAKLMGESVFVCMYVCVKHWDAFSDPLYSCTLEKYAFTHTLSLTHTHRPQCG
jgi:hypothetical protein